MTGRGPEWIRFEMNGQTFERDLSAEVFFATDLDGLNKALSENPAKFAFWATLEVRAKALVEFLENAKEAKRAELYQHYEQALSLSVTSGSDNDGKRARPTVDAIKSAIHRDDGYKALLEKLRKANEALGLLSAARNAMVQRKDCVLAVASNFRAERDAHIYNQLRDERNRVRGIPPGLPERRVG